MPWFNARKKPPPIRSLVGEGMAVQGHMSFCDGLRIDGEVHGDVIARPEARSIVVIGEKACVTGRVRAAHVIVNGEVHGPVHAEELLELQPKARIHGDVRYQLLEMHQGARVEGELKPLKSMEKPPTLTLAASNDV